MSAIRAFVMVAYPKLPYKLKNSVLRTAIERCLSSGCLVFNEDRQTYSLTNAGLMELKQLSDLSSGFNTLSLPGGGSGGDSSADPAEANAANIALNQVTDVTTTQGIKRGIALPKFSPVVSDLDLIIRKLKQQRVPEQQVLEVNGGNVQQAVPWAVFRAMKQVRSPIQMPVVVVARNILVIVSFCVAQKHLQRVAEPSGEPADSVSADTPQGVRVSELACDLGISENSIRMCLEAGINEGIYVRVGREGPSVEGSETGAETIGELYYFSARLKVMLNLENKRIGNPLAISMQVRIYE
jgi:hypothetical protein